VCAAVAGLAAAIACTRNSPAAPSSTPGSTASAVSAPALDSPADGAAITTLRPTVVVRNAAAEQAGTKLYEFQISDRIDFSASGSAGAFPVVYKIIGDAGPGGANSPSFGDNAFVERSLYVPAIDPSKP